MKHMIFAAGLALAATSASAGENGLMLKESAQGVTETVDAMVTAMEAAGIPSSRGSITGQGPSPSVKISARLGF